MSKFRGYSNSLASAYGVATFQTTANAPKNDQRRTIAPTRRMVRAALQRAITRLTELVQKPFEQNATDSWLEDTDLEKNNPSEKAKTGLHSALAAFAA